MKVWRLLNIFMPPVGFDCCPFEDGDYVVVDLMLNVLSIVYGSSVFVFVLL